MNATHLNLYQVCRLCLSELNGSSFVPIFDNKDSNLPQKIKSCFSISVEETDRLPNVLCPACTRDVERFYKFKEKVIKNNAFLRSYVFQRDRKAAQFLSGRQENSAGAPLSPPMKATKRATPTSSAKSKRTLSKSSKGEASSANRAPSLNNYDNCELSNTFFDNSNKVKVEIIPQVDNDMYSSSSSVYGEIKNNVVEMWSSSPTEESTSGFRTIKSIEDARAVASISENSLSKSPDYTTSVIRHSSDDFRDGSSSYDKYISVHVKEEVCKDEGAGEEYDSEDTKSASSLTFREEDEDKLIIDEETMEMKQYVDVHSNETIIGEDGRTSDSCILLRTLISTSNPCQIIQSNQQPLKSTHVNRENVRKAATFSPQILVNDMSSYSPTYQSSPRDGDTPNSEKSSKRRKQKCPTKSANDQVAELGEETDEEIAEVASITQHTQQSVVYHQEIVNISPVTVTCSSNGREEIVGYNQTQFLDEVLSRHSSPATTPPMVVPSQAERLHKACDVLLRAASKIQDLPPGIQQEEVVVEEEVLFANSSQLNDGPNDQITIRHNPVPLYEINFSSVNALNEANRTTKKVKSREKVQNMSTHKECNNCHAVQTTIWRRDRFGNIVCNACGLYYKLHNYDRPCRMRRDEIHKRNRKRNANENKAKKAKRNSGGNYELDSSKEQENSSGSYTPPANFSEQASHVSMCELYQPLSVSSSAIKKKRRTSAPGPATPTIKEEEQEQEHEQVFDEDEEEEEEEESQMHEIQPHIENVEEISINGSEEVDALNNHEYSEQEEKLNMSAFQLSTHFVPINGKVYEDYSNDNSMSEAPLNLAAGTHS